MSKINLLFWRPYNDTFTNYGDELCPFIVNSLTGCEIQKKDPYIRSFYSRLFHLLKLFFTFRWSLIRRMLFANETNVLAIGSIMRMGNCKSAIWGSGYMGNKEEAIGGVIYAIRGKYSLELAKIQDVKIQDNVTFGDPAILLPLILPIKANPIYSVGIIPHYSEYDAVYDKYASNYKIIDLRNPNIEKVTREILSCRYIISTSLHGIIVPHAYGIPALWFEESGLECNTNGFKFYDYFSSVGIDEYKPFKGFEILLKSSISIDDFFSNYQHVSLPHVDISVMQQNLLNVAPFNIKEEYINGK